MHGALTCSCVMYAVCMHIGCIVGVSSKRIRNAYTMLAKGMLCANCLHWWLWRSIHFCARVICMFGSGVATFPTRKKTSENANFCITLRAHTHETRAIFWHGACNMYACYKHIVCILRACLELVWCPLLSLAPILPQIKAAVFPLSPCWFAACVCLTFEPWQVSRWQTGPAPGFEGPMI